MHWLRGPLGHPVHAAAAGRRRLGPCAAALGRQKGAQLTQHTFYLRPHAPVSLWFSPLKASLVVTVEAHFGRHRITQPYALCPMP